MAKRHKSTPGEIVAARRKELGWSQDELEYRCGISKTQISKIERNLVNPEIETIRLLEAALDIPLLDLFLANRKKGEERQRKIKGKRTAWEDFQREVARRRLSEDELKTVFNRALKEMDEISQTEQASQISQASQIEQNGQTSRTISPQTGAGADGSRDVPATGGDNHDSSPGEAEADSDN